MIRGKLRGDRAERFLARMNRSRLEWTVENQARRIDNQTRGHERNLRHIDVLENSLKSLHAQVKGGAKTTWQRQRIALQKVARELAERIALLESVKETADAARLLESERVMHTVARNDGRVLADKVRQLEEDRLRLANEVKELAVDAERWRAAIVAAKAWCAIKESVGTLGPLDLTLYKEVIAASSTREPTDG